MSAVMSQRLGSFQRNAPLGIRFWDLAGGTSIVEGLDVQVFPAANPNARRRLRRHANDIYAAVDIVGQTDFERRIAAPRDLPWWQATSPPAPSYRVEVTDPLGRFLPMGFDVDLPLQGLLDVSSLVPGGAPALPLWPDDNVASPTTLAAKVPLFSAPSRTVPSPLAVVYAQMRVQGTLEIPAWTLLGASIDGQLRGLGLADTQGRVAVMFPYPNPPTQPLTSPSVAQPDFLWTVTLQAWRAATLAAPDLADILGQLASPCPVVDAVSGTPTPRRLEYRIPMTARTEAQSPADASFLLLSA